MKSKTTEEITRIITELKLQGMSQKDISTKLNLSTSTVSRVLHPEYKIAYKEKTKEYNQIHKEELRIKRKEYEKRRPEESKNKAKIYHKQYRLENVEKIQQSNREYYLKNVESSKQKRKEYYHKHKEEAALRAKKYREANKERLDQKRKEYRENNLEKVRGQIRKSVTKHRDKRNKYFREYVAERIKKDTHFLLSLRFRNRIRIALKNGYKSASSVELLGCSVQEYKDHLESTFTEGMSWEKYANGEMHVDHIKPCKDFDLTDPEQQKLCFNYKNTQFLWARDNLIYGAKDKNSVILK